MKMVKSYNSTNEILDEDTKPKVTRVTEYPYEYLESFEALDLPPPILRALRDDLKLDAPNRMQARTLPLITTKPYKDLVAQARLGSGKILCYALSMFQRIDLKLRQPQALVICPTVELAKQINNVVLAVHRHYPEVSVELVLPGDDPRLSLNAHIVIGLLSTIKRLIIRQTMPVTNLKMVILEETDFMLEVDMPEEEDEMEFYTRQPDYMKGVDMMVEQSWDIVGIFQDIASTMERDRRQRLEAVDQSSESKKEKKKRRKLIPTDPPQVLLFYSSLTDILRKLMYRIVQPNNMNLLFVNEEEKSFFCTRSYKLSPPDDKVQTKYSILESMLEYLGVFDYGGSGIQVIVYVNPGTDTTMFKEKLEAKAESDVVISVPQSLLLKPKIDDENVLKFKLGKASILITSAHVFTPGGFDQSKVHGVIFYDIPMVLNVPDYVLYYRLATQASKGLEEGFVFHLVSRQHEGLMLDIEKHFGRTSKQLKLVEVEGDDLDFYLTMLTEEASFKLDFEFGPLKKAKKVREAEEMLRMKCLFEES